MLRSETDRKGYSVDLVTSDRPSLLPGRSSFFWSVAKIIDGHPRWDAAYPTPWAFSLKIRVMMRFSLSLPKSVVSGW